MRFIWRSDFASAARSAALVDLRGQNNVFFRPVEPVLDLAMCLHVLN
jgi:hypothetical protein